MIYAATGHRPESLGGYGADVRDKLLRFALIVVDDLKPELLLIGMALGFDQAMAQAAMLRKVPFRAYLACDHPEAVWPEEAQFRFRALIEKAEYVTIISPGSYAPEKMQRRNECMVDDAQKVIALWNGSTKGGAANTVKYAMRSGKPVVNVWPQWKAL